MTEEKPKNWFKRQSKVLWFSILIGGVAMLAPLLSKWTWALLAFDSGSGVAGDAFGGFANPFVGILTAYVTYQAFRQQVKANEKQVEAQELLIEANQLYKEEISNNKEAANKQEKESWIERFENQFFRLLDYFTKAKSEFSLRRYGEYEGDTFDMLSRLCYRCQKVLEVALLNIKKSEVSEKENFNGSELQVLAALMIHYGPERFFLILSGSATCNEKFIALFKEEYLKLMYKISRPTIVGSGILLSTLQSGIKEDIEPIVNHLDFLKNYMKRKRKENLLQMRSYKDFVMHSMSFDLILYFYLVSRLSLDSLYEISFYFGFHIRLEKNVNFSENRFL